MVRCTLDPRAEPGSSTEPGGVTAGAWRGNGPTQGRGVPICPDSSGDDDSCRLARQPVATAAAMERGSGAYQRLDQPGSNTQPVARQNTGLRNTTIDAASMGTATGARSLTAQLATRQKHKRAKHQTNAATADESMDMGTGVWPGLGRCDLGDGTTEGNQCLAKG